MTSLRRAIEAYLTLRRGLGFQLAGPGRLLRRFAEYMDSEGATYVTRAAALRWAKLPAGAEPATWARRLGVVRRFAEYRAAVDPRTEVPPRSLLPHAYQRKRPYIYTDDEVVRLIEQARRLRSPSGLRAESYAALFGAMAATGMRLSEALSLNRDDLDLATGVFTIRRTKFRKTRLVPIHETTRKALERYLQARDRICRRPRSQAFFIDERGARMNEWLVRWTFVRLSRAIRLRQPARSHGYGPRIHDLRHRMAVTTLLRWYRSGVDVERRLPVLATYLGHTKVTDTYWYISAVPELLELAAARMEKVWRP